jgi:NitT/TauT family transport system substrate-binding protein
MTMKRHRAVQAGMLIGFSLLLGASLWIGLAAVSSAAGPDHVSIRTNWLWYGSHSIFFLAKEKGFYKDANLDVDIKQGNGSSNVARLVANKDSTFGYIAIGALINQAAQGAPIISVATIDAMGADAVLCRPDAGISKVQDLNGKEILTTAGAGVNSFWPVVVKNAGLDEKSIKLVNVAENALVPSYLRGMAPCLLGGMDDKPAEIEANGGKKPVIFPYSEYGVDQPGYAIATHKSLVKDNPDLVRRFVYATLRGVKLARENPDAAVKAMSDWSSLDEAGTKQARQVLDFTLSILISRNNTEKRLGLNVQKDWESALNLLKTYRGLETNMTADQFYTNQFVPASLP